MYILPLLFFVVLFARAITCYDSRIVKGKFIVIENDKLAKILIEKHVILYRRNTLKKDRNKMSIAGFILYLCIGVIIFLIPVLHIIPPIPCEPLETDLAQKYLFANTLNEKIPLVATIILLCVEFLYFAIKLFPTIKQTKEKWLKILILVSLLLLVVSNVFVMTFLIYDLLKF